RRLWRRARYGTVKTVPCRAASKAPVLAAIIAATALAWAGCSSKQPAPPEPVVSVQVAAVQKETIKRMITANALLFPLDQATIVPKISAPILKFYVSRGSHVHEGQLLATLESKDLSAAVVENQGAYRQAQATYATSTKVTLPEQIQTAELTVQSTRQAMQTDQLIYQSRLKLYKAGAIARNLMDQSKVTYIQANNLYQIALKHLKALQSIGKQQQMKSAQGQLTTAQGKFLAAQAQYNYSNITSPITGVVTDRPLYEGEMASAGSPLITVMNTSSVVAREHISPQEAAYLRVGDPATISLGEGLDSVTGKVTVVSPALDPGSTTVQVWVEAPNPGGRLKAGSTVTVSMVAETIPNALVIPTVALLTAPDGTTSVMVVGPDNVAHQTSVKTGVRQGSEVEITSGLKSGQQVITDGAYGLADGTKVKF
ncbi:MAG: efflux RND transporter periplasmic adaptor subunit, partial [Terriglobia bacterium]